VDDDCAAPAEQPSLRVDGASVVSHDCVRAFEQGGNGFNRALPRNGDRMPGIFEKGFVPAEIAFPVKGQGNVRFFPRTKDKIDHEQAHEPKEPLRVENIGAGEIHSPVCVGSQDRPANAGNGDQDY
jgi:hypothetical protein